MEINDHSDSDSNGASLEHTKNISFSSAADRAGAFTLNYNWCFLETGSLL